MAADAFTDYAENLVGNYFLRATAPAAPPATVYLALFTADPTDTGSLAAEVAAGEYARQPITFSAPAPAGTFANNAIVTFPEAVSGWGVVTHAALIDTASGAGNMSYKNPLTAAVNVQSGQSVTLEVGQGVVVHS